MRLNAVRTFGTALVLGLAGLATGCAPLPAGAPKAGWVQLALPAGEWVDLGLAPEAAIAAGSGTLSAPRRLMGLRGAKGEWLAALVVTANDLQTWSPPTAFLTCTAAGGETVDDATQGSRVRADCLRTKLFADHRDWLQRHHPDLAAMLDGAKLAVSAPYAWVDYTFTSTNGAYVTVNAVIDQRLLIPAEHSGYALLRATVPAAEWSQQLARAVRISTGMLNGHLALPPFPFPSPALPSAPSSKSLKES